jgi:hypothetical protein
MIDGKVRLATIEERKLVFLKLGQAKPLPEDATNWTERDVWVIEHNGVISGCVCGRWVYQIEPLYLFPEFVRDAPPVTLRRAVFKLARTIEGWMKDHGIRFYFAYIEKKPMQRVAREYGMVPIYRKGKLFGRDLEG